MEYSNLLRNDLDLSKITNKNDFLDQRVIKRYGSLVPLTELDEDLLRKNQKESTDSQKESILHHKIMMKKIKLTNKQTKIA